jgi:hypothetical protein
MKTKIKESDLKDEVIAQYKFSKQLTDPIHDRANSQEELYRNYIDPALYPHNARVFDPRIFRNIETITPKMVANEPTGSFFPQEAGDLKTSEVLKALIKYDWRRAEMFPKLVTFVKSLLIFGTSFGFVHWEYREKIKTRMAPHDVNGLKVWSPARTEQEAIVEFDGPNFEPLNFYDCFPDPNATSIHNMRWFILRSFKTVKELREENETRGMDYYKNLDELEKKVEEKKMEKGKGGGKPEDLYWKEHRRMMIGAQDLTGEDPSNPEFMILRRFTRDKWVDIVPEYDLVIRDAEDPYFHGELPIVYGVDYPYPGELYGMSEIEPVERIQRAINAVLNQRLDNVQLVLRAMWKVRKGAGVDMHTLISSPGNIVTTDDMNAVEPIQVPDVTGNTFVGTMNYLTAAMQNGSGITDYTMGINTSANVATDTATGTRLVQQEANAQFKLKIQLFYHMVIERIVNQWKDLRIQFTTEEQKLRIVGREEVDYMLKNTDMATTSIKGESIAPGDFETPARMQLSNDRNFAFLTIYPDDIQPSIVGDYDFIATVSSEAITDPIVLQENFFNAVDRVKDPMWMQGLESQGKQLNFVELTAKIFDKLNIGVEGSNVLTDFKNPGEENNSTIRAQINFKDLPPEGQVQLADQAGIKIQEGQAPVQPQSPPQAEAGAAAPTMAGPAPVPSFMQGGINGAQ